MKTINGSTNSSQWTFKLEASEIAYNIPNKNSTVRVEVYIGRASSQSYLGGNYSLSVNCAGQVQSDNGVIPYPTYISGGSWYLLKTFTFTVSNTGNPTTISISSSMSSSDFTPSSASASGSLTLTKLHDAPNITSFSLVEKNTQLTNLSVPNNTIVQYLSNKTATINVSTYDNATITNYSIYHNNVLIGSSTSNTITINFANVGELMDAGTGSIGLTVAVTDSLGGYSTKIFNFSIIRYTRPTIEKTSTTIKRKTGNGTVLTDNKVLLNFVGTCYKGNDVIGNANKPTVQYKIWNETEPNYSTLTTPNTPNVTIKDYEISDILYTSTYNYKIKIYDTFTSTESEINLKVDKVPTGVSVWTEYKDRVDFLRLTVQNSDPFGYSTDEHMIGTWINGKPIYRKLVFVNFATSGTSAITPHQISDLSYVISQKLTWFDTEDNAWYEQNKDAGISDYFVRLDNITTTDVVIRQNNFNWQDRTINRFCVLEYIKTTD